MNKPNPIQAKRLRANLWKLNLLSAMRAALMLIAIAVPFYMANGLDMQDIFWLQGLFGLTILVLEVPSGYFSDRLGRRQTLLVAFSVATIGLGLYTFADSFADFLLAEILLGVGFSFMSGTDSALTWETLEALDESDRFGTVLGRMRFYSNLGEAAASIAGAALAVISFRLPLIGEAIIYGLTLPVVLSLIEPDAELDKRRARPRCGPIGLARETFGLNPDLRRLVVFTAFFSVSTLAAVWYAQPWFSLAGFPLAAFGILWAGLRIATGVASLFAHRVHRLGGTYGTFWFLIACVGLGFLVPACSTATWLVGFFLLFSLARGVAVIVVSEAINRRIPSDRRATILSCESMVARLIFAPLSPLLGWVADAWSIGTAMGFCAVLFTAGSAVLLARWQAWQVLSPPRRGGDTNIL